MDYTAKLQALLDAAERDIYLTDGIYEISNTLIIHSNTRIRLSDNAVISSCVSIRTRPKQVK